MASKFPALSELSGPCDKCGRLVTAPIPLHLDESDRNIIAAWPTKPVPGLSCPHCLASTPLAPVPCVYWSENWSALVLDGPRPARYVLRMISSWISEPPSGRKLAEKVVRVFCSMESFSYALRTNCGSYTTDVCSKVMPHWDFEIIALTQFVDDALSLDEPLFAYGVLAKIIQAHRDLYFDQGLQNALMIAAEASGDEPLMPSDPMTASEHFQQVEAYFKSQWPFPELDDYVIQFETPCSLETSKPLSGSFNGIVQDSPGPLAVCDVCCQLLAGVYNLRSTAQRQQKELSAALTAESKALMQMRSMWTSLTKSERTSLAQNFEAMTGEMLQQAFGL